MKRRRGIVLALVGLVLATVATAALAATTQGTDVKVSEDALSEVTIDVNPTDPDNLVVVGHDDSQCHLFARCGRAPTVDGQAALTSTHHNANAAVQHLAVTSCILLDAVQP